MFIVRQISSQDLKPLKALASILDSFNLPNQEDVLREQIENSFLSFADKTRPKDQAIYMFVLEDFLQKKVIGTSLIFGKKGTKEKPNTYLRVLEKTHRAPSIKIEKKHQLLRFEFDTDGPSQIGGLILHPDFRGVPASLGKLLSFSRFAYMGMNLERFENKIIAELLPPFNEDGSSELWEAFGKRFTGLPYQEADRLSRTNKGFITNLFPSEDIFTCLFSEKAQSVIGKTGAETIPVQHMLEKIGFRYLASVDPFDGGPHYGAKPSEISLIKRMKKVQLADEKLVGMGKRGLVSFDTKQGFSCFFANHRLDEEVSQIQLEEEARHLLEKLEANLESLHLIYPL